MKDAWLAVGLNNEAKMSGTYIFLCRNSPTLKYVHHYFANGYSTSFKDSSNPTFGISLSSLRTFKSNISCNFRVENKVLTDINYQKPYVLLAYGAGRNMKLKC